MLSFGEAAPTPLRVVLGEYDTGWENPQQSLRQAAELVERAAQYGTDLVVLPEMCTTGFTMNAERCAEPLDGPSAERLSRIASRSRVHVLAGLATRAGDRFYNSAVLFGPDGAVRGEYRKQRLFEMGGEHESYERGHELVVFDIGGVQVAPLICYELRFGELFRELAPRVDAFVVIANWPTARRLHWEVLIQARAIENQCFVIGVNRLGHGNGTAYSGGSLAFGPFGERLTPARDAEWMQMYPPMRTAISPVETGRVRSRFPVVPDERPRVLAPA